MQLMSTHIVIRANNVGGRCSWQTTRFTACIHVDIIKLAHIVFADINMFISKCVSSLRPSKEFYDLIILVAQRVARAAAQSSMLSMRFAMCIETVPHQDYYPHFFSLSITPNKISANHSCKERNRLLWSHPARVSRPQTHQHTNIGKIWIFDLNPSENRRSNGSSPWQPTRLLCAHQRVNEPAWKLENWARHASASISYNKVQINKLCCVDDKLVQFNQFYIRNAPIIARV